MMKSKLKKFKWLTLILIFGMAWSCEQEDIPSLVKDEGTSEMSTYIITQLNQFPDNGFIKLTEQYGEPDWNLAHVQGFETSE